MFHSGFMMAKHTIEKEKMDELKKDYPFLNLDDFVYCGNTGGNLFTNKPSSLLFDNNVYQSNKYCISDKDEIYISTKTRGYPCTCSYFFGKCCHDKILERKWSCCNKIIKGTMYDLAKIKCTI